MSEATPGIIKTCRATSIADVQLMRKSKYIQGINDCFPNVMNDLKKGNLVLFSGLACCVQGLLNYLHFYHINTERLITIDLVCRGIGSPYLYERYRKMIEKKENSKIVNVVHRDKKSAGWVGCCTLELENGEKRHGQIMAVLFSKGYFFDQKCLPCNYNTPYRNSTFTIGDFWQYQSLKSHHSSEGLSYVICDDKGKKIIDVLINKGIVIAEEQDFESNVPCTLKCETTETKKHRFWRNFFYRHPAIAFHYALPVYRKVLRVLKRSILKY